MSSQNIQDLANHVDMLSKTLVNEQRQDLSKEQVDQARQALVKDNLLFPRSVKSIHDPVILGQEYGLISFTPAKDVKPNANGIYGVFKLRGNFATLEESQSYAEKLIRNHDSYNEVHTVRVGQCIPLSKKSEFVEETNSIDLNKEVEAIVKENKEILEGEYQQDPLDQYIMLRVKKAQLMWTLAETRKRIENEVIPAIKRTKEDIRKMNVEYPEFDKQYYQRYIDARESVGIKDQDKLNYSYFMQYLLDDNDLNLD
ncbi:hypothetical protein EBU71_18855 [bacterium]|nr:hypothetical protein [Candidatus Elulimicrobium humile]